MLTRALDVIGGLFAEKSVPSISQDTFLVWEPCTHSHAEVVPGYVKYLLDLGFHVSVLMTPRRYKEGLFSRFHDDRIVLNKLSQRSIRRYIAKNGLSGARGILITTARKISGSDSYDAELSLFAGKSPAQKVLLVEHDVKKAANSGSLHSEIITLRKIHYENCTTTVVNPHYFGDVRITPKNPDVVNFITIGAMRGKRRNARLLTEAVAALDERGIRNFKITVVGKGNLWGVPSRIRRYFDIKGRLDFSGMYDEIERADFFLPLLDVDNPLHERYITTGTSGSFQLIYGFAKPCLIAEKFAAVNDLNKENSLVYAANADLAHAMFKAIAMTQEEYGVMQGELRRCANRIYAESLTNLQGLIQR